MGDEVKLFREEMGTDQPLLVIGVGSEVSYIEEAAIRLFLIYTPTSSFRSSVVCLSIKLKKMLSSFGARTQPFYHVVVDGNVLRQVTTESDLTALVFLKVDHHLCIIARQPSHFCVSHSLVRLTESKAFVKSI